jgi:hypothetical protein
MAEKSNPRPRERVKQPLKPWAQEMVDEFMDTVDGDETPQFYVALALLMLAGEVRVLRTQIDELFGAPKDV